MINLDHTFHLKQVSNQNLHFWPLCRGHCAAISAKMTKKRQKWPKKAKNRSFGTFFFFLPIGILIWGDFLRSKSHFNVVYTSKTAKNTPNRPKTGQNRLKTGQNGLFLPKVQTEGAVPPVNRSQTAGLWTCQCFTLVDKPKTPYLTQNQLKTAQCRVGLRGPLVRSRGSKKTFFSTKTDFSQNDPGPFCSTSGVILSLKKRFLGLSESSKALNMPWKQLFW